MAVHDFGPGASSSADGDGFSKLSFRPRDPVLRDKVRKLEDEAEIQQSSDPEDDSTRKRIGHELNDLRLLDDQLHTIGASYQEIKGGFCFRIPPIGELREEFLSKHDISEMSPGERAEAVLAFFNYSGGRAIQLAGEFVEGAEPKEQAKFVWWITHMENPGIARQALRYVSDIELQGELIGVICERGDARQVLSALSDHDEPLHRIALLHRLVALGGALSVLKGLAVARDDVEREPLVAFLDGTGDPFFQNLALNNLEGSRLFNGLFNRVIQSGNQRYVASLVRFRSRGVTADGVVESSFDEPPSGEVK